MDRNSILAKVIEVTGETLDVDVDEIDELTEFKSLGADSFDLLELVTAFEDELGYTLDDEALQQITKIGDVVDIVENMD